MSGSYSDAGDHDVYLIHTLNIVILVLSAFFFVGAVLSVLGIRRDPWKSQTRTFHSDSRS
jgi:hypothetical protein